MGRFYDFDQERYISVNENTKKSLANSMNPKETNRTKKTVSKRLSKVQAIFLSGVLVVGAITVPIAIEEQKEINQRIEIEQKEAEERTHGSLQDDISNFIDGLFTNELDMSEVSKKIGSLVLDREKDGFEHAASDEISILMQCTHYNPHTEITTYDLNKVAQKIFQLDKSLYDYEICATLKDMKGYAFNRIPEYGCTNADQLIKCLKAYAPEDMKEYFEDMNSLEDFLTKKGKTTLEEFYQSQNQKENVESVLEIVESYQKDKGARQNGSL